MTERFSLRFCAAAVNVRSSVPGIREACAALLMPSMVVDDQLPEVDLTVDIDAGAWARLTSRERDGLARFPSLRTGTTGATFSLLEHSAEQRAVLRHEDPESEVLHLRYVDAERHLSVGVEPADLHHRGVARTLKLVLGALARRRGVIALHGSVVARGGRGLALLGPRASGKSTLAFVLATRCGWRHVSDDLVFVHLDHDGRLAASGWPFRIPVATNLLLDGDAPSGPLRRYPQGPPPLAGSAWDGDSRQRVFVDADELTALFGVETAPVAALTGVVFPQARQGLVGWRAAPATPDADWLTRHTATSRQLQHATDHLGLLGEVGVPSPTAVAVQAELTELLTALPRASLAYGPDLNADPAACWQEVLDSLEHPSSPSISIRPSPAAFNVCE